MAFFQTDYDLNYYIGGYAVLNGISLVLLFLGIFFLELMALNASRNLHRAMIRSIVAAPARLFDVTPIGRIVNRLSGDTQILDEVRELWVRGLCGICRESVINFTPTLKLTAS